ncbi:MAG: hypothetical protein LBD50_01180 [Rickettsiales bacterium]|jgi:hypothetical protein|nr:hypothetical protein [Rickettsiales bacterium]
MIKNSSLLFVLCFFCSFASRADDCLSYKLNPKVEVHIPDWRKEVVQPLKPMDLWHGNVAATLVENYEIAGDPTSVEDGYCVSLKEVRATFGYSDFLVKIDSRHSPESCAYDAILAHEDEHIRAYLSVIDDYKDNAHDAVYSAAKSVMPVFVQTEEELGAALDILNKKLQSHPELILLNQKIQAEQEIRNKRVDQIEKNLYLKKCMD